MRLIDKDKTIALIDQGLISTSADIDNMEEVKAIPVEWLHKQLVDMLYNREIHSDYMSAFHRIIARWEESR